MDQQYLPNSTDKHSILSYIAVSPRLISNWVYNFCIWKFSHLDNINHPALKDENFLWEEDDTVAETMNKGILIKRAFQYSPKDAQQRPALIIKNGTTSLGPKLSLGDQTHKPKNLLGQADPNKHAMVGDRNQMVALGGSCVVYAVHSTHAAAEILGEEIFFSLIDYMHVAKNVLKLDEFRPVSMGELHKIEEFKDNWVVSIDISYKYTRNNIIRQEAPLLKNITISDQHNLIN